MKKILFLFFLSLCTVLHADQLEWISLEQAKKAQTFLNEQKEILAYRACDDNPTYKTLEINKVEYRYTGTKEYYQIYISGINQKKETEEWATDLAYLYFNLNGNAQNVGKYLNFECNPCSESFEWGKDPRISVEINISGEWKNYVNQKYDSHVIRLNLISNEEGNVSGEVFTRNIKTKQEFTYIIEGNVSKEGIARLEVIERGKKGSFSLAWLEVSLQGENLHWEKESGDNTLFPTSINLTKN